MTACRPIWKFAWKHKVPIIITPLRPPEFIVEAAHSYGGVVFHDVINVKHAKKAAEQGVDGLIWYAPGPAVMPVPCHLWRAGARGQAMVPVARFYCPARWGTAFALPRRWLWAQTSPISVHALSLRKRPMPTRVIKTCWWKARRTILSLWDKRVYRR